MIDILIEVKKLEEGKKLKALGAAAALCLGGSCAGGPQPDQRWALEKSIDDMTDHVKKSELQRKKTELSLKMIDAERDLRRKNK